MDNFIVRSFFLFSLHHQQTQKTVNENNEQKVVNLSNSMMGEIHYLNYPRAMPKFVDFTQHLIAPLGNVISIELQNVQFDQSNCNDNATIEVRELIEYLNSSSTTSHHMMR
jgi:hypothetical protein